MSHPLYTSTPHSPYFIPGGQGMLGMSNIELLLERLWQDYLEVNPHAHAVCDLLLSEGEKVLNDHIAFRTFDDPKVNIDKVEKAFLDGGYEQAGTYDFEEKRLNARHYLHPNEHLPKVFISELRVGEFSNDAQHIIEELVDHVPNELPGTPHFPVSGRPWKVSYQTYEALRGESEYAAWVSAFGFRANHFTVNVNELKKFDELSKLNTFLKSHGFQLNDSGGEIKGSPDVYLEQSSTKASDVPVDFVDGVQPIPACYYEFAKRYPMPDGKLFRGFVTQSADKIFESTDKDS